MKIYTGGPALPVFSEQADDRKSTSGMTLRDYFAAKALGNGYTQSGNAENVARYAYGIADAMLKIKGEQS
jgi:hypothetical protein